MENEHLTNTILGKPFFFRTEKNIYSSFLNTFMIGATNNSLEVGCYF